MSDREPPLVMASEPSTISRKRFAAALLAASLALNLFLIKRLSSTSTKPGGAIAIPIREVRSGDDTNQPASTSAHLNSTTVAATSATNPWEALARHDYATAIQWLRAAHCPEETIQDLIALRMAATSQAEALERATRRRANRPWWKADLFRESQADSRDRQELLARLRVDFEATLGVPFQTAVQEFFPWSFSADRDPVLPEHRSAYQEMLARHREEQAAISDRGILGGVVDDRQEAELAELKRRQKVEIDALLSPAERDELALRSSAAANAVREHLPEARSAAEYREMVRIARELGFDDATSSNSTAPGGSEAARVAELRRRVAEQLGPDAMTDLEKGEAARVREEQRRETERAEAVILDRMRKLGTEFGFEAGAVEQFMARLKARQEELVKEHSGVPSDSPEGRKLGELIRAEINRIGSETLGPRSAEFIQKLDGP